MQPRVSPQIPNNVLSHWYAIVDGVRFSTNDFYENVLQELAAKNLPQLKSSRVEYHEGGFLTDKRVYLRLARERFAFDICAAPFGENYFFSLRFIEVPRSGWFRLFGLIVIAWLSLILALRAARNSDFVVIFLARWILKGAQGKSGSSPPPVVPASKIEMPDFDSFFLGLPIVGDLYERFRKDTYYRHDTRLLFHTIIMEVVKAKVDEFTAAKGVKLLRTFDYNPILAELYKRETVRPGTDKVNSE